MAAIDSLLALVESQKASGIVFRSREPPVLIGGKGRGLTMPAIDGEMIQLIAGEILAPAELTQLRASGACDAVYRSKGQGSFVVEARVTGDKMSLKLRVGGGGGGGGGQAAAKAAPAVPVLPAPPQLATAAAEPSMIAPSAPPAPTAIRVAARTSTSIGPEGTSHLAGLIARAVDSTISDIIVSAGQALWLRSGEGMVESSGDVVSGPEIEAFVGALLDPRRREILERAGSVDFPWEAPAIDALGAAELPQRFRVNVFHQARGMAIALRPVRRRVPTLGELNLPDSVGALGGLPSGLVLVVGPAGAGKSSTLASIVETVNRSQPRHIVTLEDPIEFVYEPRRSLIHQREVGTHVARFADGLRAALRESPDVILLGEMRDRETMAEALTAAETGHLVLSTLHSASAPMAIDRIIDGFPDRERAQISLQLAGCLRAIVTQRLLAGIAPGTRFPALEIFMVNRAAAALIREGKTHQLPTLIQTSRDDGMVAFDTSLVDLARAGRISGETAQGASQSPSEMQRRLHDVAPAYDARR